MDIGMHGKAQKALRDVWDTALCRSRTSAGVSMTSMNRAYTTEA